MKVKHKKSAWRKFIPAEYTVTEKVRITTNVNNLNHTAVENGGK